MNRQKWTKKEFIFLVCLTAVVAFLRLYQLDKIPPGLHGDEALTGLDALRILKEGWIGPYVESALGIPSGNLYWTAFIVRLFGVSPFTVRTSIALLGIFTIPALYFFARTLFNRRVAVFASIFLTFSFWHLHFSRTAFMMISAPFIECLTLVLLFQVLTTNNKLHWAVAGGLAGLGVYSYNTYQVFLLAVSLFLAFVFLQERNKRRLIQPLLIFCITCLLAALPLISYALNPKNNYFSHYKIYYVSNDPDYQKAETVSQEVQFFAKKFVNTASIFHKSRPLDYVDALGNAPLLDTITGILFAGGIIVSLKKIKDCRYFLLLAGLATAFLPVIFSVGGANRRVITALPFVFLLAALPAAKLWSKCFGRVVILAFCLFIAGYNLNYYFNDLAKASMTKWVFCYDFVQVINHLKTFPEDSIFVYFYSPRWSYDYETRRFLLPNMPGENRSKEFGPPEEDSEFSIERKHNQGVIYLLMPPYENLVDEIQRKYPNGKYQEFHDEDGRLMFVSYYLPPIL